VKGIVFFSHTDLQEKMQIFDLLKRIIHHVRDCTTSILWCIHLINACKPLHETLSHAIFRQSSRKRQDIEISSSPHALSDFLDGKWTQYSLFECFLTRKQLVAQEDNVRFYPLCANCVSKVETVEGPPPADEILFLV